MENNNRMFRHGDVLLIPISELPQDAKKLDRKELAFGEKTGHAHRIDIGDLFETKDGKLYLRAKKLTKVSHEEHKSSPIPQGVYLVTQKRQYNAENGWERVQD